MDARRKERLYSPEGKQDGLKRAKKKDTIQEHINQPFGLSKTWEGVSVCGGR